MDGGGSQQPSFNTGNSSSSSGWPPSPMGQSSMGQNSQYNPFQLQSYTPQNQQSWQSMSPSFNAFSQLSAQGQQTPLTNQQGINAAMQQQTALQAAQPTSAPVQNFTLADANQTAGLPAAGQAAPAEQSPTSIFNPPAPVAAPVAPAMGTPLSYIDWGNQPGKESTVRAQFVTPTSAMKDQNYQKYLATFKPQ